MPFCLTLTKIWHYIRTWTKTYIAICFRKTSVYRNGLYIRVCNSRNIVSVSLCLVPFWKRQMVLSRKVWHFVIAYMWRKFWSYLHSYLNSPRHSKLKSSLIILFRKTNADFHQRATFFLWLAEYSRHTTSFLDLICSCRTLFCDTFDQTLLHFILIMAPTRGYSSSFGM